MDAVIHELSAPMRGHQRRVFPVFFPVPGAIPTETGWLQTGPTANKSRAYRGFLRRLEKASTSRGHSARQSAGTRIFFRFFILFGYFLYAIAGTVPPRHGRKQT